MLKFVSRTSNSCNYIRRSKARHISQIQVLQTNPDLETFNDLYFNQQPVILKRGFLDLPAIQKWPTDGFHHLRRNGDRLVPIELSKSGSSYASTRDFERVEVPMSVFVDFLGHAKRSIEGGVSVDSVGVYLAQHALFDTFPELYEDVCGTDFIASTATSGDTDSSGGANSGPRKVPRYTTLGRGDIYNINAWIGISTHTPLHRDPYHNLFVQLISSKRVVMFPPTMRHKLDMHSDPLLKNTSRIPDIFDDSVHSDLRQDAFEATLEEGDGLYIPEGWIHSFKGRSGITGSVNWWFK